MSLEHLILVHFQKFWKISMLAVTNSVSYLNCYLNPDIWLRLILISIRYQTCFCNYFNKKYPI